MLRDAPSTAFINHIVSCLQAPPDALSKIVQSLCNIGKVKPPLRLLTTQALALLIERVGGSEIFNNLADETRLSLFLARCIWIDLGGW